VFEGALQRHPTIGSQSIDWLRAATLRRAGGNLLGRHLTTLETKVSAFSSSFAATSTCGFSHKKKEKAAHDGAAVGALAHNADRGAINTASYTTPNADVAK
jgi:hypothetical protein